jgi:hypothetical protein
MQDHNKSSGSIGRLEVLPHNVLEFLANLPETPNVLQMMQEHHLYTTRVLLGGSLAVSVHHMPAHQFDAFIAPFFDISILCGDVSARYVWSTRHRIDALNQALQAGNLKKYVVPDWGYLLIGP